MADPRYSYQFTADAPPLAFPVSQGYVPIDYVPPALPELELQQLLSGKPVGISPFGSSINIPSYELTTPEYVDGIPDDDAWMIAAGPGGAYGAYRAGQAMRGAYDDLIASRTATPSVSTTQPALPSGAPRAALLPGSDPLALPPRPTFSTPREQVMYDLENAALRERYSPNTAQYPRVTSADIDNLYEPFTSARRKVIDRGDAYRAGTYEPGKYVRTDEEYATWYRNADNQMDKDANRARKPAKETGLGAQGKAALQRLANYASKAGSTAMSAAGFTGIISQLIKPDPFDPIGNYIIRSNPEAYPEQVKQYNDAVSSVWY